MSPRYVVNLAVSLDGHVADKDGGVGWLDAHNPQEYDFAGFLGKVDLMVQGSRTYEQVLGFGAWPYGAIPNVVFSSRTLPIPDGGDVRFHRGDAAGLLR